MDTSRKTHRVLLWAIALSLVVHVVMIVLLNMQSSDVLPLDTGPPIDPGPDQVADMFDTQMIHTEGRSESQQWQKFEADTNKLELIDPREVEKMAVMIEKALGVEPIERAMTPRPDAAGPFDGSTALLYDVEKITNDDELTAYRHTMIDTAGRKMVYEVAGDLMTTDQLKVYEVFQMGRQRPNLRILIDMVRRYAESKRQVEKKAAD